MQQLGISAVHPNATTAFSVLLLYSAPIDLDAACARIPQKWPGNWTAPSWAEGTDGAGRILQFKAGEVWVLLSPFNDVFSPDRGKLPPHEFFVVASFFPTPEAKIPTKPGMLPEVPEQGGKENAAQLRARHFTVAAHTIYTQVADALLEEPAAIGAFRAELGVVQPPEMVHELAQLLTEGQVPLPLWVNVRTLASGFGRTFGLPIFGHLDLEVTAASPETSYELLANAANYVVSGDAYLLPGQTLSLGTGNPVTLTQEISTVDGATVIKLAN
ncbi:MAG: DUF4261 domain-containing protein [Trueperella sp.]|nr:DUF4261 domain-containing protein [Trueperella sp.]